VVKKAKKPPTIEAEVNRFLDDIGHKFLWEFLRDVLPLLELYNITEEDDWVKECMEGMDTDIRQVRLASTVYQLSQIADRYGRKLMKLHLDHSGLYERMEEFKRRVDEGMSNGFTLEQV
jgi:hypothetical protein